MAAGPERIFPDVALGLGLHHIERHDGEEHGERAGVRDDGHAAGQHLLEFELDKATHDAHLQNEPHGDAGGALHHSRRRA